jgi:glycosyltransferase involved in cell wall biosynthesis
VKRSSVQAARGAHGSAQGERVPFRGVSRITLASFRLGLADGVSIEAAKWAWALRELGHDVTTVAGEGVADVYVTGLGLTPTGAPDRDELARALDAADVVVVENLCSLPINPAARDAVAAVLAGRPAVLHHHDLPWQRPHLAHHGGPPTDGAWRHVTINERSAAELDARGIAATVVPNHFDLDPPRGDRAAMRAAIGVRDGATLVVHPVRAIPRKDVGAALRLAEKLGAVYWLVGGPEDGYGPELDRLLALARTGARLGVPHGFTIADVYAAADVVVLSSSWEGFGNAAIESVAFRRPLARRRYPVMAEIEAHGLQYFDLEAVEALRAFVTSPDPALLESNVAAARAAYDLSLLPGRLAAVLEGVDLTHRR